MSSMGAMGSRELKRGIVEDHEYKAPLAFREQVQTELFLDTGSGIKNLITRCRTEWMVVWRSSNRTPPDYGHLGGTEMIAGLSKLDCGLIRDMRTALRLTWEETKVIRSIKAYARTIFSPTPPLEDDKGDDPLLVIEPLRPYQPYRKRGRGMWTSLRATPMRWTSISYHVSILDLSKLDLIPFSARGISSNLGWRIGIHATKAHCLFAAS